MKMAKESRRRFLFVTVFLVVLLISGAYASLVPNVHAAEATNQEKGLAILNTVVGLDLTKYAVTLQEDSQASYLDVVPLDNIVYDLTSGGSRLKMLYTFAGGNLQMIHVLETTGTPSLKSPTSANAVEMAKTFLNNYQAYTADSLYGELKSTLNGVDANKNATITSGKTQLEVCATTGYTRFKWTYTFNGAIASSKFVAMGFKNGFLTAFVDNWQLYKIGSTSLSLSKNEAVTIALDAARAHSWSMKLDDDALDAKNFNETKVSWTALIFDCSRGADKPAVRIL
jgi:competence protein ComGC